MKKDQKIELEVDVDSLNLDELINQGAIYPNFVELTGGKIHDHFFASFAFLDDEELTIAQVLQIVNIPVKLNNMFFSKRINGTTYRICFISCRKKYAEQLSSIVFPVLHKTLIDIHHNNYLDMCCEFVNMITCDQVDVVKEYKNNGNENLSEQTAAEL